MLTGFPESCPGTLVYPSVLCEGLGGRACGGSGRLVPVWVAPHLPLFLLCSVAASPRKGTEITHSFLSIIF